ncbi:jg1983 [Pararge aegeria aegeria]|uniref:Jg1983 protein n=1 Tax=Pararge aegeria aegeria TaxID=348720 RepID=A0A8S4QVI1_9NEOP|nr:jg1983 [Pararge aegeria aegeria]
MDFKQSRVAAAGGAGEALRRKRRLHRDEEQPEGRKEGTAKLARRPRDRLRPLAIALSAAIILTSAAAYAPWPRRQSEVVRAHTMPLHTLHSVVPSAAYVSEDD